MSTRNLRAKAEKSYNEDSLIDFQSLDQTNPRNYSFGSPTTTRNEEPKRQRNKFIARQNRLRKKMELEMLKDQVLSLSYENDALKKQLNKDPIFAEISISIEFDAFFKRMVIDSMRSIFHLPTVNGYDHAVYVVNASNPNFPIIFATPGFANLCGYSMVEIIGQNCGFLSGELTSKTELGKLNSAYVEGEDVTVNLINYKKDGSMFNNKLRIANLRHESCPDRTVYLIGLHIEVPASACLGDISEEQQLMLQDMLLDPNLAPSPCPGSLCDHESPLQDFVSPATTSVEDCTTPSPFNFAAIQQHFRSDDSLLNLTPDFNLNFNFNSGDQSVPLSSGDNSPTDSSISMSPGNVRSECKKDFMLKTVSPMIVRKVAGVKDMGVLSPRAVNGGKKGPLAGMCKFKKEVLIDGFSAEKDNKSAFCRVPKSPVKCYMKSNFSSFSTLSHSSFDNFQVDNAVHNNSTPESSEADDLTWSGMKF